jgi:hypothetical protein
MIVPVPSTLPRWGRSSLALALSGLLYASCTGSEDTEPYVPAVSGATQPEAGGDMIGEEEACDRLKSAAEDAYERLGCPEPDFEECPAFVRPAGGSGCYEYSEGSIEACEDIYENADSCRNLSPCLATAVPNAELPTCEQLVVPGAGGAGGEGGGGGSGGGGGAELAGAGGVAGPTPQGGSPNGGVPAGGNAAGGAVNGGAEN